MKFYMENDGRVEFEREDFTDEEFALLRVMFRVTEKFSDMMYSGPFYCDKYLQEDIYSLQRKLGIYDLLN